MTRTDIALQDSDISEDEARKALDAVLADKRLHISDRGKSILRYLGDHGFSRDAVSVKGYSIAIDVLGRPASFDPSIDPIVRIELSRLRSALLQFYEAHGHECPIEISLPKGKYVLSFCRRTAELPMQSPQRPEVSADAQPPPQRHRPAVLTGIAATAIVCVGAALLAFVFRQPAPVSAKPLVAIDFHADDPALLRESGTVKDSIVNALGNFRTLTLQSETGTLPSSAQTDVAYVLHIKYRADQDNRSVWWQVNDPQHNQILDSGVSYVRVAGISPGEAEARLASALSQKIAAATGVINARLVQKNNRPLTGNACVVQSEIDLAQGLPLSDGYRCLQRTLESSPDDSDALAAMARILAAGPHGPHFDPQQSLRLAQRAEVITPQSDRVQLALLQAFLSNGRADMALVAGRLGLQLNPNNQDLKSGLALAYFTSGAWDQATGLLSGGEPEMLPPTATGRLVLLLNAARRNDWENAARFAKQVPAQSGRVIGSDLAALSVAMPQAIRTEFQAEARFDVGRFRSWADQLVVSDNSFAAGDLILTDLNLLRASDRNAQGDDGYTAVGLRDLP